MADALRATPLLFDCHESSVHREAVGVAVLHEKLSQLVDTAPLRMAAFDNLMRFKELAPKLLRPGDGAVISGISNWREATELVSRFGACSRGPSRRSNSPPRGGPYHLVICASFHVDLDHLDLKARQLKGEGGSSCSAFCDMLFCDVETIALQEEVVQAAFFDGHRRVGWAVTVLAPRDEGGRCPETWVQLPERSPILTYRSFLNGCGGDAAPAADRTPPDPVGESTARVAFSFYNKPSLLDAGRRMARRFGRGAFVIRFASLTDCRQLRAETFEEALCRELHGLMQHESRSPHRESLRRHATTGDGLEGVARDCARRLADRALDEYVVYTSIRDLQSIRAGPDMRLLNEYDPQTSIILCGQVCLSGDPGCTFDDVLLSIFSMALQGSHVRDNGAPGTSAGLCSAAEKGDSKRAPTPSPWTGDDHRHAARRGLSGEATEESTGGAKSTLGREAQMVQEANARARLEKQARRRKSLGNGLLQGNATLPLRKLDFDGGPAAATDRDPGVPKRTRRRGGHSKDTVGDPTTKRALEAVQRRLLARPDDMQDEDPVSSRFTGRKKAAQPSAARQTKLVLHLSEFQEAIL